jgi:peptide/nickel transport system permease protein
MTENTFVNPFPQQEDKRRSFKADFTRFLKRSPLAVIGIVIVAIMILIALTSQWIAPYDPIGVDLNSKLLAPSAQHWLGTDDMGRDVFSRVLAGARVSLLSAFIIIAISIVVGTVIGVIAGYAGGWVDDILMRLTDIFLAFPAFILAMAISATMGASLQNALIAIASVWWPWYARLVRGQVLSIRNLEYVQASRTIGARASRIIFKQILPNAFGPIIVQGTLDVGNAIMLTASLSFIGLGAQPPTPEWGAMVSTGRLYFLSYWWVPTMPGLAIFLCVIGFNLLGDAIRDFMDVRERAL